MERKNPHRIVDLNNVLLPEPPEAARPARRVPRQRAVQLFEEYPFIFNQEWPSRPIELLRWNASRVDIATPVINRVTEALNAMVGTVLGEPDYDKLPPTTVVAYLVRNWRQFKQQGRIRGYQTPVPEAITMLCKYYPNAMLDTLMGLVGQHLKEYLEKKSQGLQQRRPENAEAELKLQEQYQWVYGAQQRLMVAVPWLEDDEFLDAISGERIGKRDLTIH